jgi:hypothetical protein
MTELLRQVVAEIEKLPPQQQDANEAPASLVNATRLLTELKDEQAWEKRFAATTNSQWDKLAEMVRQEIADGETSPQY